MKFNPQNFPKQHQLMAVLNLATDATFRMLKYCVAVLRVRFTDTECISKTKVANLPLFFGRFSLTTSLILQPISGGVFAHSPPLPSLELIIAIISLVSVKWKTIAFPFCKMCIDSNAFTLNFVVTFIQYTLHCTKHKRMPSNNNDCIRIKTIK